ncbi:hypothetical protein C8F04DRAFT_1398582 [Mycena alexandri]|uniref:Uncharacterized protein n=1 Tax=Mycena alexandri TaxID=1745969 RepID=A0AAD6WXN8_9AGAR|nr:hypothetical protein C8F04DRAFT_1398582 [Mycena alexandri]
MAAPLLTLANEAAALLTQIQQILTEVDHIGDARTTPIRKIRELLHTGCLVSAQNRVQGVVDGLRGLLHQEALLSRLSATSLPEKRLVYEETPNPVYRPKLMPAYLLSVCRNIRPPTQSGLIYEATVDRLAGAFLGFYLPPSHQFLLQPQHTFRALAPEEVIAMEAEWSRVVAPGDASSRLDMLSFSPGASSTPRRGTGVMPVIGTPPVEGTSSLPSSAGLDIVERIVNLARDGLRRPDISIIHQGLIGPEAPAPTEMTICMAENKVKNPAAAVKQLKGYAEAYGRDSSPNMRFFAFILGDRGLEVAMFRFAESKTELVAVVEEGDDSDDDGCWYSVCDPFVHDTMCELAAEVQKNTWGLRWGYENPA